MSQVTVDIQVATSYTPLPTDAQITDWATQAVRSLNRDAELTVRIVDEDEIKQLNATYRGKDKPTNVLSFPVDLPAGVEDELLGDVVICATVVAQEAQAQHKSFESHFAHMIVHGCLHLMGYDHETPEQADIMEPKEIAIMAELHFNNPYKGSLHHE